MSLEKLDPDAIADQIDAQLNPTGGSGGTKRVFGTGEKGGRRKKKSAEVKVGQKINAAERHGSSEKTPSGEIADVINYLIKVDENDPSLTAMSKYLDWLTANIAKPEKYIQVDDEYDIWVGYTASVKAGGGGRQTSNNARRRTHLITGITAEWEKSRKADPNQIKVMKLLRERIVKHLNNWRQILMLRPNQTVSQNTLQAEINKFI